MRAEARMTNDAFPREKQLLGAQLRTEFPRREKEFVWL